MSCLTVTFLNSFKSLIIMVFIYRQEKVKEKLKTAIPVGEHAWPSLHEVAPFIIPSTHPFLKRFIYVSSDIIMKVCFVSLILIVASICLGS